MTTPVSIQSTTMRTVATRLLPFLLICYAIAFIDRTNIAVASLTMNADIGLSDAAFGLGAGLFFITYTVLEVPSNLILARVGARLWIMRIMITWGIVTILMAFVSNEWTFYAGRLLLGACEAGFYPGVIYFLSRWFPGQFRGRAFAMFQIGGPIALMIGSPLAGALLGLDGAAGLHGWQWVFIITGIPAIIAGVLTLFRLDDAPKKAKWLTDEQRTWLQGRIDEETDAANSHGSAAWKSPIVWLVSGVNFFIILALYGVSLWLPRLVQATTGASNFAASAISAIPYVAAVAAVILVARFADRSGKYRTIVIICCAAGALGLVFAAAVGNPWVSLAGIAVASGGLYAAIPSMWSMTTQVIAGPAAAAAVAVISAIGNVGGFVGPYLAGLINEATGRPASSLYLMGASLLAAMLCAAAVRQRTHPRRTESAPTGADATTPNLG